MIVAIAPRKPAIAAKAPSGFSSICLPSLPMTALNRGVSVRGGANHPLPFFTSWRIPSQCLVFQSLSHFMVGFFPKDRGCGEGDSSGLELAAHSMHRRAVKARLRPRGPILFFAKASEQIHDYGLTRLIERSQRHVLGLCQQFFGFRHFQHSYVGVAL